MELFSVNFHFDVVVEVIAGVAAAVEPYITGLYTLSVNQFTLRGFNIVPVFAFTQFTGVIQIIVE
jgi:hypothetical protein